MQEWHPINPLYVPNQTKFMINSKVNIIKLISSFDFVQLLRLRLACKNMSFDTSEHLLLAYVDEDKRFSTVSALGIK